MLDYDLGVKTLTQKDPVFSEIFRQLGYLPQRKRAASFETFVSTIVGQQLSGAAADTIFKRLLTLLDDDLQPQNILRKESAELRAVGISNAKVTYIQGLATQFSDGTIDLNSWTKKSDQELHLELMKIRGIGPWTANIIMLFNFERLDAFPLGDATLEKAFLEIWKKPLDELNLYIKEWSPYSGIVAMYMWSCVDSR
jgi:DNA-3-methyladenine glycosylase II